MPDLHLGDAYNNENETDDVSQELSSSLPHVGLPLIHTLSSTILTFL